MLILFAYVTHSYSTKPRKALFQMRYFQAHTVFTDTMARLTAAANNDRC